jgi:hypothetical protein
MAVVEYKRPTTLTGRALKVTVVLDPDEVVHLPPPPNGQPRVVFRISVADRIVTADLNAKSVKKAIATILEAGSDNVVCILQGKLAADNMLAEAGLAVQPKIKAT